MTERIYHAADAAAMRALGARLAQVLTRGDLVVLTGQLGSGKTTLTQGMGAGLDVRGQVASPTFIIARLHHAAGAGPDLVHVDAYRLTSLEELDDLDLDTSLDEAVTVVEWGEGLAERLSGDRMEVTIRRPRGAGRQGDLSAGQQGEPQGDPVQGADLHDGPREVRVTLVGPRWDGVVLPDIG